MTTDWRNVVSVAALCCAASAGAANAQDAGTHFTHNGLQYRSGGGNVEVTLGGRLHLDGASVDDGITTTEDGEVRRARLELSANLYDRLHLRIDREFAHGGGWRNAWVRYDLSDAFNVKAGNFTAPFSMEDLGSSNDTMFMERSLANALAPGFGVGLGVSYEGPHYGVSIAYLGDSIDAEDNIQAAKGKGVVGRFTWNPIESRQNVVHLGFGAEQREFDTGSVRSISSGPEASLGPTVVRTGSIANVDSSTSFNVEGGWSSGPVLIEGQFISTNISRTAAADLNFSGYYAQIGWIVTGERHDYSDAAGTFSGPNPRGAWGAVELAVRVSSLDLTDATGAGGQADDVTAGINWYIGRNLRLMGNYVHSKVDGVIPLLDRDTDVFEARAQLAF